MQQTTLRNLNSQLVSTSNKAVHRINLLANNRQIQNVKNDPNKNNLHNNNKLHILILKLFMATAVNS